MCPREIKCVNNNSHCFTVQWLKVHTRFDGTQNTDINTNTLAHMLQHSRDGFWSLLKVILQINGWNVKFNDFIRLSWPSIKMTVLIAQWNEIKLILLWLYTDIMSLSLHLIFQNKIPANKITWLNTPHNEPLNEISFFIKYYCSCVQMIYIYATFG